MQHLRENLAAADLALSAEVVVELDAIAGEAAHWVREIVARSTPVMRPHRRRKKRAWHAARLESS